jgi:hypothetical protein
VTGVGAPLHEPGGGRLAWLGPVSCAVAVLGALGFYVTTSIAFDFTYGEDSSGFSFNFRSGMDWWYHVSLIALFLAGAALGVAGVARATRLRPVAWIGAALNVVCALLLALFLGLAISQGAFQ